MRTAIVATTLVTALAVMAGLVDPVRAQTCSTPLERAAISELGTTVVDIRNAGDARLFFVEQEGRIRVYENGALLATPFLDIQSVVASGGERGLLSLAFHPDYPATPWFYVLYTTHAVTGASLGDVVIARYSVSANPNLANANSARFMLAIPHAAESNHNGGQLQFGPDDGYLYASVGDGGGGCDAECDAQRGESMLGKVLRLDVNRDAAPYYAIPASNPFVGAGPPLDEIWATGLRNPYRFSFDRQTAGMWIGDVGQGDREEVDFQPSGTPGGRNYGWPVMEGTVCGTCSLGGCPSGVSTCSSPALTMPVHEYGRSVGTTVIGGYVYRGARIPALRGCYLFGDNGGGAAIWALDPAQPSARRTLLADVFDLTTFGEDNAGELYAAFGGTVYKLNGPAVTVAAVPALPLWSLLGLAGSLLGLVVAGVRRTLASRAG